MPAQCGIFRDVFHGLFLWNFIKMLPYFLKCALIVPSVCQREEDGRDQLSLCP